MYWHSLLFGTFCGKNKLYICACFEDVFYMLCTCFVWSLSTSSLSATTLSSSHLSIIMSTNFASITLHLPKTSPHVLIEKTSWLSINLATFVFVCFFVIFFVLLSFTVLRLFRYWICVPWESKDYYSNGHSEKTIIMVSFVYVSLSSWFLIDLRSIH